MINIYCSNISICWCSLLGFALSMLKQKTHISPRNTYMHIRIIFKTLFTVTKLYHLSLPLAPFHYYFQYNTVETIRHTCNFNLTLKKISQSSGKKKIKKLFPFYLLFSIYYLLFTKLTLKE